MRTDFSEEACPAMRPASLAPAPGEPGAIELTEAELELVCGRRLQVRGFKRPAHRARAMIAAEALAHAFAMAAIARPFVGRFLGWLGGHATRSMPSRAPFAAG